MLNRSKDSHVDHQMVIINASESNRSPRDCKKQGDMLSFD